MAVIRYAERNGTRRPWLVQLVARRTTKVVAAALANKTARMVCALMTGGEHYREPTIPIEQDKARSRRSAARAHFSRSSLGRCPPRAAVLRMRGVEFDLASAGTCNSPPHEARGLMELFNAALPGRKHLTVANLIRSPA